MTSRARQLARAAALVAGHGRVVAEFFDIGQSRTLAWARRPQAAALVAALADPDRGWDAIVHSSSQIPAAVDTAIALSAVSVTRPTIALLVASALRGTWLGRSNNGLTSRAVMTWNAGRF
jgi:hypothetical protein